MGKEERLEKILPKGRGLIIPIDHAVSSFRKGLENLSELIPLISSESIIAHKGVVSRYNSENNFIMHLSASTIHGGKRQTIKF